jgi:hypothetical protein
MPAIQNKVFKAESLNAEKGIMSSIDIRRDENKYVVCLCLYNKLIQTAFLTEEAARQQMRNYRLLYKAKKAKF